MNIEDRLLFLCGDSQKKLSKKISGIYTNSKNVKPNSVFVAIKGLKTDGHLYIKEAIKNGASALVISSKNSVKDYNFKGLVCEVPNTNNTLHLLLNEYYDFPSQKMFCVGVTGTNGKTTVSNMVSFIFSYCGWRTGLIGTIKNSFEQKQKKSVLTTPSEVSLYSVLNSFYKEGAQAVVMEVSSIGLDQQRVSGVDFNLGVFTNLSEDHLDYHNNMSEYFEAKKKLFTPSCFSKSNHFLAVLNLDDCFGIQLAREIKQPYISYGHKTAQVGWRILSEDLLSCVFEISFKNKKSRVNLSLSGSYNVSNAVAALCCAIGAGFSLTKAIQALQKFPGVEGRLEKIQFKNRPLVFVDYAHTPKALEVTLDFLKKNKNKNSKLFTVFGCGGNRDKTKRPIMSKIAQQLSDQVILTSDNPRNEDPLEIIKDCMSGLTNKKNIFTEVNRHKAIIYALECATKSDIVLVAGKGHETEQIIGSQRIYFDDREVIKNYFLKKAP